MPQKTKITQIVFPLGGVNTSLGYQSQPPYTTCDASNVRGRERSLDRLTGGSRPGLVRYASIGSNKPQLLDGVTVMQDDGFSVWEDSFQYDSMSHLSPLSPTYPYGILPSVSSGSVQ